MVPYSPIIGKFHIFQRGILRHRINHQHSRPLLPPLPPPCSWLPLTRWVQLQLGPPWASKLSEGQVPPLHPHQGGWHPCFLPWSEEEQVLLLCAWASCKGGTERRALCGQPLGKRCSGILMFSVFISHWENLFSIKMSGQLLLRVYKLLLALSITGSFCAKNPYKS